ncbi:MAG TPA: transcriptional regulator, partial [Spirochaetaceae bacterium]|nr:transcriptional regulator [Spirochaetaceae bacterium]
MIRVLLVDDEKNFIDGVSLLLEDYDCKCSVAYNGREGLSALEKSAFDVIVTDLIMPEMDGIAFLTEAHRLYPEIPSIVMTAHGGDKENRIVRALGAKNFILKPVDVDQLANMIDNLNESSRLASERDFFKEKLREHESKSNLTEVMGKSVATRQLVKLVLQVAPTDLSILVTGESGVGKQVVAESIHKNSLRSGAAFVDAHCASFSPTLLEDELFGHEKGAYTG